MKTHSRIAVLAALTFTLALGAFADREISAEKITVKLEEGQVIRYKQIASTEMEMMGNSTEVNVTTVMKLEVLESSKGWTKLRSSTESIEMDGDMPPGGDESINAVKELVITFEVNDLGKTRNVVAENIEDLDPMAQEGAKAGARALQFVGFMGVQFPNKPVDVGSTWELKLKGEDMLGDSEIFSDIDGDIPVKFEVLEFLNYKGKRHAKISAGTSGDLGMILSSPAGDLDVAMTMESTSIFWVDLATGLVTKAESEGDTSTDFGVGSMEQQISTVIERIK